VSFEILFVLGLLAVALVLFVQERFPADGVAVGCVIALVVAGILTPKEAFGAFGNEALITVAALFVVAAGLIRTGAVDFLGRKILRYAKGSEAKTMIALMLAGAACSAFINNTPIVVVFLPIALSLAAATGTPASKLLMPLSFATIAGGMCTVIGTSTNVLVSAALPKYGMESLPLFTPLPLALIGLALTILYMATIGRKLLPSRTGVVTATSGGAIVDYVTELEATPGSPLLGQPIAELVRIGRERGLTLVQIIRDEFIYDPSAHGLRFEAGDVLVVQGDAAALHGLLRVEGLTLARELAHPDFTARGKEVTLAELLVRPPSTAIGERVRDLNLYSRHGVAVIAVQRHGLHIREKVGDLRLKIGDILLVMAEEPALKQLHEARNFLLIEGAQEQVKLPHKAGIAIAVTLGIIALAAFDLPQLPISILSVAGAAVLVLCGGLSTRDAYRALDLPVLVLIAGTICLGLAMESSGAAAWIAGGLVGAAAPLGDVGLLSIIYLITNVLTALISNNGSALLMLPIALATAEAGGMSPLPFILAIMFAASIDYSTPIGYQVNTIIYGPGGYRFADFVKVGGPLNLLWWILATVMIPVFWPLRPA
jgi:di/tricarboxylate transporter